MKKTLQEKKELATRLVSYTASTGALLALGSFANGQVVYSGIQNMEIGMPSDNLEVDMDGDLTPDFGFIIYGSSSEWTYGGVYNIKSAMGYGVIVNPRTDSYANSWITRLTTITSSTSTYSGGTSITSNYYPIVNGLGSGVQVDSAQTMWSNLQYPYWAGVLGYGAYFSVTGPTSYSYGFGYGDFFGEEKYIGVRFYIGTEQHYGWIRVSLGERIDPMTIIDWAYESTPGDSIITGAGDDIGPEVVLDAGVTTTNQPTVVVSISFIEKAYDFELTDILVTNGSASNLTEITAGHEYTVEATANSAGEVMVALPADGVVDLIGNGNELASTSWTYAPPVAIDIANSEGIQIYPNPVSSTLHIELENQATVQIVDLNGKVVYRQERLLNETIDVSNFNPGVYIVQVHDNERVKQHKIIIE